MRYCNAPAQFRPVRRSVAAILVAAAVVVAAFCISPLRPQNSPRWRIVIDAVEQPNSAAIYLAHRRGYFAEQGIAVTLRAHPTGLAALQRHMTEPSGYAVCADTPFVNAISHGDAVVATATISVTNAFIRIIGRRSANLTSMASLKGLRIGYAPGTNSQYALLASLRLAGLSPADVKLAPLSGSEMVAELMENGLDAASLWEPFSSLARRSLGAECVEVDTDSVYRAMWLLVRHRDGASTELDRAVLTALRRASGAMSSLSAPELADLSADMRIESELLHQLLDGCSFRLSLNHALILNLEAQLRALRPLTSIDILSAISPLGLAMINREAVSIVHPELIGR